MAPSKETGAFRRGAPALTRLAAAARALFGVGREASSRGDAPSRNGGAGAATTGRGERPIPLCAFQMLGLDDVRAELGDRWPALRDKVHLIARNTIAKHLVRGDVFEAHGDDGYVVLFATLGAAEAKFKTNVISREIREHLLGVKEAACIGVSSVCAEITPNTLDAGDDAAVVELAFRHVAPEPCLPCGTRAPAWKAPAADAPNVYPGHRFTPVWDVSQMTLIHYRTAVNATPENHEFETDLGLVRAVAEDLRALACAGMRRPVTVVVRQTSIASATRRTALLEALTDIEPPLRKLMTVEVVLSLGQEWGYACRTFQEGARNKGYAWSVLLDPDQSQPIPAARPQCVGLTLANARRSEAEAMRILTAFAGRARAVDLKCAAHGLGSRPLVLGAIAAGFRYLSGAAIHEDLDDLSNALRFEGADLYKDFTTGVRRG
jgi:hypothetical protein